MATAKVDIANSALTILGHVTISSLSDNVRAAKLCNQRYEFVKAAVLRAYPWNCAVKRASLTASGTAPTFGFDYQYVLPTDCLRVLRMDYLDYQWKVEGRNLLTDEATCNIVYIYSVAEGYMDSLLVEAIAARLAMDIGFALTGSDAVVKNAATLYQAKLDEAQSVDAQEGTEEEIEADTWLNARV